MTDSAPLLLDCTLRDGGYYSAWYFSPALIEVYLIAMKTAQVDVVELGFLFLKNQGSRAPAPSAQGGSEQASWFGSQSTVTSA